jgi:non-reducing end alpha-L-arabinofuranosidase
MNTGSGGTTKDIMSVDGFADTATQDTFCGTSVCTVSLLYDQSGNGNTLKTGSPGTTSGGTYSNTNDFESSANKKSLTVGGHKVYALYTNAREGYRTALGVKGKNVPLGNVAEGIYELADGTHAGTACCWDFGNVSPDPTVYVTMNTIFFGTGFWGSGAGSGPWFMGDFEGGVWAGGTGASTVNNPSSPSLKVPYALGILHTPVGKYALRMADVSSATDLTTAYDGAIPSGKTWGNAGAIVLGLGGDNSNNSFGTFYEGAVTVGSPSNATDLLIMKNIQAAGYGK